jgi:hypothetical protein
MTGAASGKAGAAAAATTERTRAVIARAAPGWLAPAMTQRRPGTGTGIARTLMRVESKLLWAAPFSAAQLRPGRRKRLNDCPPVDAMLAFHRAA